MTRESILTVQKTARRFVKISSAGAAKQKPPYFYLQPRLLFIALFFFMLCFTVPQEKGGNLISPGC
jgi:hypothetical protein